MRILEKSLRRFVLLAQIGIAAVTLSAGADRAKGPAAKDGIALPTDTCQGPKVLGIKKLPYRSRKQARDTIQVKQGTVVYTFTRINAGVPDLSLKARVEGDTIRVVETGRLVKMKEILTLELLVAGLCPGKTYYFQAILFHDGITLPLTLVNQPFQMPEQDTLITPGVRTEVPVAPFLHLSH